MWRRLYGALAWFPRLLGRIPGTRFYREACCGSRFFLAAWLIGSSIASIALPVSILWEFNGHDDKGRNFALELVKIYPHMLLIPPMMLWAVLWVLGSALAEAWTKLRDTIRPRRDFIRGSIAAVGIAVVFVVIELSSSPIMLLELSPRGPNRDAWRQLYSEHRTVLQERRAAHSGEQPSEAQTSLYRKVDYDEFSPSRRWSISRIFYAATYFISIFAVASLYLSLPVSRDLRATKTRNRFLTLLVATAAAYTVWFPARFYYNQQIKGVLFGSAHATKWVDLILWSGLVLFGLGVLIAYWSEIDKIKSLLGVVTAIFVPLAGLVNAPMLSPLIGISSSPSHWTGVFAFLATTFYVFWRLLK